MDKTRFLLLLALPLLLLAGCSNDDLEGTEPGGTTGNGGDIRFEIGFAPQGGAAYAAADGNGAPVTRAATGADFTSEWETGDEIGIFAVAHGQTLTTATIYDNIQNIKLTYNGTDWNLDGGVELWWPGSGGKLDFYAYYPYDATATDPTAIAFNVLADQNDATGGKSNYNLSDLLTAKADNSGNGYGKGETVQLTLSHALAMVQVSIPSGGKGFGPGENLTVTLRGVKAKAALDLGAVNTTPGSGVSLAATGNDATSITMYRLEQPTDGNYETSYTYRALVPAQEVAAGTSLFLFDHEGRQLLRDAALAAKLEMTAGTAEKFTRSLPATLIYTELIAAAGKIFSMGETGWATPVHDVTFTKDFYMSKYQVTNAQYAAFLNAKGIGNDGKGSVTYYKNNFTTPATENQTFVYSNTWGVKWDTDKWVSQIGYENHPVINVTWYGAKAYADWIGGALPTEAQWEYACRAGTTTAFSFGNSENDMGAYGWSSENSNSKTHPVGEKKPNPWGLYDMHGNVLEWCSDWYGSGYYSDPSAGSDPTGPPTGSPRVLRGGCWLNSAQDCRSASRFSYNPVNAYYDIGFRVVFVP